MAHISAILATGTEEYIMYFLSKYNAIIDRNTKLARNATELPPKTKAYTNVAIEGVRLMSKALIK